MTTQQQEQQPDQRDTRGRQRRRISRRSLVIITVLILAVTISIIWILSYLNLIPSFLAPIFTIIITVLGVVFAFFQSMHLFIPVDKDELHESLKQRNPDFNFPLAPAPSPQIPPINVQLPTNQSSSMQPLPSDKTAHRGIVGLPPPTDPRTIQQRKHVVEEVYAKLAQPNITAITLTGIGGVGKSTLAALIYRYVEEQRQASASPFQAETLWFTIDPAVTFADLASNLFESLDRPLPDLGNLAPQNQAVALFNALNNTDKPRLIILDQFENLLDWDTGHAFTDRPGVGEWLDIINSQPCACRILLTSRPRPVGTREYPPTYLHEYAIGGLEMHEGIALLQSQGIEGTEIELQSAVLRCDGHAFALTLLATLMRDHHLDLPTLFKNSSLWSGNIATNILDQIYTQKLNNAQRELLLAFSFYREPVSIEAALAIITNTPRTQIPLALQALVTQHLVEAVGEGHYQLHAIISDYAQGRFSRSSEEANQGALLIAHAKAAQYYLQRAETTTLPRGKRRVVSDVHDLIEAVWQFCQAEHWQEAYDLMEKEEILEDLNDWRDYATLQELCELLLPLDKWHAERLQEAQVYSILGESYRVLGKIEGAEKYSHWALTKYRELGVRSEEGRALRDLGRIYSDIGKIKQAGECFEAALAIYKHVGDTLGEGGALRDLGWVYYRLGQLENARQYYEQALDIFNTAQIFKGNSNLLNNLGRVYRVLGKRAKAQSYYEQALNLNREKEDPIGEGATLYNLGKLYNDLQQNDQALIYLEQALSIRRRLGYLRGEGSTLRAIGQVYLARKEETHAWKCFEEALRISRVVGNSRGEAACLKYLGEVCRLLGRKTDARGYFRQALAIQRRIADSLEESSTLYYVGKFYYEQRQYDVALSCFILDIRFLNEVQHPYREEAQIWIEKIQNELGDEQFTALLAAVEPQAQQIVDQTLSNGLQFSD